MDGIKKGVKSRAVECHNWDSVTKALSHANGVTPQAAINQYACHADTNHMIFAVSFAQIVPIHGAFLRKEALLLNDQKIVDKKYLDRAGFHERKV